jgi:hypothetical protein
VSLVDSYFVLRYLLLSLTVIKPERITDDKMAFGILEHRHMELVPGTGESSFNVLKKSEC